MQYIFYKKKLINGKKRRVYKKKGSKKLYLKHKGRMVNVVKYKKYLKRKQKKVGGLRGIFNTKKITLGQRSRQGKKVLVNLKNTATTMYQDRNRKREREREKAEKNKPLSWSAKAENAARRDLQKANEKKRWVAKQGHNLYGRFGDINNKNNWRVKF